MWFFVNKLSFENFIGCNVVFIFLDIVFVIKKVKKNIGIVGLCMCSFLLRCFSVVFLISRGSCWWCLKGNCCEKKSEYKNKCYFFLDKC